MTSKTPSSAQKITPLNRLGQKVEGSGPISPEMLEKANAVIAELSPQYLGWAARDLDALRSAMAAIEQGDESSLPRVQAAYHVAHEMKGQGTTFNYPLVTELAQSICRIIDGASHLDDATIDLLEAHVNALQRVIDEKLSGDGGDAGEELLNRLDRQRDAHPNLARELPPC